MGGALYLVRHGRVAAPPPAGWVDRTGVHSWRAACDASGLHALDRPPAELIAVARRAEHVVASDLPRAAESAARLSNGRAVELTDRLREAPLPVPLLPGRLPIALWEAMIHARWALDIIRGRDVAGDDVRRAGEAARWLDALARSGTTIAVTHGVFRRILVGALREQGWRVRTGRFDHAHWSAWLLRPADE